MPPRGAALFLSKTEGQNLSHQISATADLCCIVIRRMVIISVEHYKFDGCASSYLVAVSLKIDCADVSTWRIL